MPKKAEICLTPPSNPSEGFLDGWHTLSVKTFSGKPNKGLKPNGTKISAKASQV
ncbi:MAG: hypothetical protein F6K41_19730 [Symploca sp. SIO3E6]|nr:hypothetical protein [Caldora sp. SIO3E6]